MGVYAAAAGAVYKGIGSDKAAKAASDAAAAQEGEARRQRAEAIGAAQTAGERTMNLANASPRELRAYEMSLGAAERQLAQDQRLVDAIDPALMEASKQILGLIRGDNANTPYAAMRDKQRQEVLNNIRQRFGPGGETTSAGQKMLRDFDINANYQGEQVRQGSIGNLFNVLNARPDLSRSASLANAAGANYANLQARRVNASEFAGTSLLNAMNGTNTAVLNSAGSAYTGSLLKGRAMDQIGNRFLDFASQAAGQTVGAFTGGVGGTGKPGQSAPQQQNMQAVNEKDWSTTA